LELPLEETDLERASEMLTAARRRSGSYIVVHSGASVAARRWPAEQFAAVADRLAEAGHEVVLTGVASERPIVQAVSAAMHHPAVDLCGRTDLGTLGGLVSKAALVLCNDTGISHVAAAVHTPSVVISTGDNPARWAPVNRRLHRVLCRAQGVTIHDAYRAADALLMKHPMPVDLVTA